MYCELVAVTTAGAAATTGVMKAASALGFGAAKATPANKKTASTICW